MVAFTPGKRNLLSEDDLNYLCVLGFRASQAGSPQQTGHGTAPTPAHSHAQGKVMFGVYHNPQEFVAAACKVQHPSNLEILVPDMLREAVRRNVSTPADVLARGRTETIRKWIALQLEEESLKANMSSLRAKVLRGKRLKLFGKVLAEIHHQDEKVVDDKCSGFSLTGRLPRSPDSYQGHPARSHPQSHVDGQPKVRPIDGYKASQVNACVTQTEQVTIHSMDVVAGTVAYWLKCARSMQAATPALWPSVGT